MSNLENSAPLYLSIDGEGITLSDLHDRVLSISDYTDGLRTLLKAGLEQETMDDMGIFHAAMCILDQGIRKETEYLWPDMRAANEAAAKVMVDGKIAANEQRIAELEASQAEMEGAGHE